MILYKKYYFIFIIALVFNLSCLEQGIEGEKNKFEITNTRHEFKGNKINIANQSPIANNGKINVIVEIPAGTIEKWEFDKKEETIIHETVDEKYREVQYLGYPGNYGFIPGTLLPLGMGGDGDPLDVIVLGPAVERGAVLECKIIGVLEMLDFGEQDDKIIAISKNSPFKTVKSIIDLDIKYPGVLTIISTWFANYKGSGAIEIIGVRNEIRAEEILIKAMSEYKKGR